MGLKQIMIDFFNLHFSAAASFRLRFAMIDIALFILRS